MEKIIGLGNALVDVLVPLDDDGVLDELSLPKGAMTLIDEHKYRTIGGFLEQMKTSLSTGGSAANTIRALAHLGGETGFVGKVGNDKHGDFFCRSMEEQGTKTHLLLSDKLPSGVATTFVSPDGERTFGTYLGAAAALVPEELTLEMFKGYTYLYIEGYMVQDHALMLRSVELAREAGLQVCLDMASYNIVREEREFFSLLINKYVDIVFANEEEAEAFTGKEAEKAVDDIAGMCSIAVVKIGSKGALVRKGTEKVHVKALPVKKVADTTGAGDFFAAGFLYGLTCGFGLAKCGHMGATLAGKVIQTVGAELDEACWEELRWTCKDEFVD